jgi:hypothetical protein
MTNLETGFLKDAELFFKQYKTLGDKTFLQLEEKDFFFQPSPQSNSIAIIIQHLYGNMLSRFTNFLTEDGEKEWRQRDAEFLSTASTKKELLNKWEEGWNCVFDALQHLQPNDLLKTIYIRKEPYFVYNAILRQLTHYASHVGQIITIARMVKDDEWLSLSIPKSKKGSL